MTTIRHRVLLRIGCLIVLVASQHLCGGFLAPRARRQRRLGLRLCAVEPKNDFTNLLLDHLTRNDTSIIRVDGYVLSKRSLGKHLIFVDFQTTDGDLCQAMLRREYYTGDYPGYTRCLLKGAKLQVTGVASPTRNPGNAVLLLQSMTLLALPHQVQHIQIILQQAVDGAIPIDHIANICNREPKLLIPPPDSSSKQYLKALANDIYQELPEDAKYPKAADQQELSKRGNFVLPKAPDEWQRIPKELLESATMSAVPIKSIEDALNQHPF